MASLLILTLLLLPFILPPTTQKQSLPQFYESLRQFPRLPRSPTLVDRLRYRSHKLYFHYLVTGPGYVLDPLERICFDLFMTVLFGAALWFALLVPPPLVRLLQQGLITGILGGNETELASAAGDEMVRFASGNMSLCVTTVFGTTSVASNGTAFGA